MLDDRGLVREWLVGPLTGRARHVRDIIGDEVARVRVDDTIRSVTAYMASARLDAVCVVDDTGRLAGILTTADLVDSLAGIRQVNERRTTTAETPALFRMTPVTASARRQPRPITADGRPS